MNALEQLGVRLVGEQLRVAEDGDLCLESEQLPFSGAVQLPLLGGGVLAVAVGDVSGDGEGGERDGVRDGFGLATCGLANGTDDIAREGDGFLPDFEVSDATSHGRKISFWRGGVAIYRARGGSERCEAFWLAGRSSL